MAKSDQVKDTYNPPSVSAPQWEDVLFSDIEVAPFVGNLYYQYERFSSSGQNA